MLLFILSGSVFADIAGMFQYISCCYLSTVVSGPWCSLYSFNTSHVVIYLASRISYWSRINVSIHLMLLFIQGLLFSFCQFTAFQYISCCYLSSTLITEISRKCSFNTSHVVIYPDGETLVIIGSSFNTSHVVIYPVKGTDFLHLFEFQYISCCYLSFAICACIAAFFVSIHLMLLFIVV